MFNSVLLVATIEQTEQCLFVVAHVTCVNPFVFPSMCHALFFPPLVPSLPTILKVDGHVTFGPNNEVAEITIGADVTVYKGATLTIRCPVEGPSNPMVYWTSQGRPVIGKAVKVGNDLVISDIDKRYALTFTCNARTNRGRVDAESSVIVEGIGNWRSNILSFRLYPFLALFRTPIEKTQNIAQHNTKH